MVDIEKINDAITAFEKDSGITVSEEARQLIVLTLSAVSEDPHPRWQVPSEELDQRADRILQDLPKLLPTGTEEERIKNSLTFFDVLHFIAKNMDQFKERYLPF